MREGFQFHRLVPLLLAVSALTLVIPSAALSPEASGLRGGDTSLAPPLAATLPGAYFTENRGQVSNADVRFYAASGPLALGFADGAVLIALQEPRAPRAPLEGFRVPVVAAPEPEARARGVLVRITFEGAEPVAPEARGELPFRSNFFLGDDPAGWRVRVRNYREVAYPDLYPGIDLVYRATEEGIKYEFRVAPDEDVSAIRATLEGVDSLAADREGLLARTALGDLRDAAPVAYEGSGRRVACGFLVRGARSYGFRCGARDPTQRLVIDPLIYATFLAGGSDTALDIASDAWGNAFVAGYTESANFPASAGAFDLTYNGSGDAFVAKLDPTGATLLYATYLGGTGSDGAWAVAAGPFGTAYVAGDTSSPDFPLTPGSYNSSSVAGLEPFVAKLSASGDALLYSTHFGGSGLEFIHAIALDGGAVVAVGDTTSPDFPATPGAFDETCGTDGACDNDGTFLYPDAFVAKLNAAGSDLVFATFLGGSNGDYGGGAEGAGWGKSLALGPAGAVYVTGVTASADFPTTPGVVSGTYHGSGDAFVAALRADGGSLVYSTFLGGRIQDWGYGLAVSPLGGAYVTGFTSSPDFPVTPGAYQTAVRSHDAFVARLSPSGDRLVYSTYLGGGGLDGGVAIALDSAGNAIVAGDTDSADFPTTPDAVRGTYGGAEDAFLAALNASGQALVYGSYFGGFRGDYFSAVDVDRANRIYAAGFSGSSDFPVTPGAYDTSVDGIGDGVVVRLGALAPPDAAPTLSWTGEGGYVSDGLEPEAGTTATTFAYRVAYADADNDPPGSIELRIERPAGTPWATLPMSLTGWVGTPGRYDAGALFEADTMLPAGSDFWYSFNATDDWTWATGAPTVPVDAPDVIVVDLPPTAVARVTPTVAAMGETVTFDATASTDDHGIAAYSWSFGDGATDANATAAHAYSSRGAFYPLLTVWDTAGQADVDSAVVRIENRPPIADAGPDGVAAKNKSVSLDGTNSRDPDGDPLTYAWSQASGPPVALAGEDTATPTFTPGRSGAYAFVLAVDDGWGGASIDTVNVTVFNGDPLADAGPDRSAQKGTLVALDGTGSSDPDGDALTFAWTQIGGAPVTLAGADTARPTFTPTRAGTYSFRLTVNDIEGATSADAATVTAWGLPPTARLVANRTTTHVSEGIAFDGSDSSDPDGTIVDFAFAFGDGAAANGSEASRVHSYGAPGTYTVVLVVTDDDGNTSRAETTVRIASPPVPASPNWKPLVALAFAIVLALVGTLCSRRRPWKGAAGRMAVMKAFAATTLPCVLLEAATGIVSLLTGWLAIPPLVGPGTAADLGILVAGVVIMVYRVRKRMPPK